MASQSNHIMHIKLKFKRYFTNCFVECSFFIIFALNLKLITIKDLAM